MKGRCCASPARSSPTITHIVPPAAGDMRRWVVASQGNEGRRGAIGILRRIVCFLSPATPEQNSTTYGRAASALSALWLMMESNRLD